MKGSFDDKRQKKIQAFTPKLEALTESKGRAKNENPDKFFGMSPWQVDFLNIFNSMAFQRINHKMQVQPLKNGFDGLGISSPHISDRGMHIRLVVRISALAAKALGLNDFLCMAIALGHDVGHTPYGHNGEDVLGIKHSLNSAVILQLVEKNGKGLNLTWEVLSGILDHSRNNEELYFDESKPNETNVVVIADKLSYLFLDIKELSYNRPDWFDCPQIFEFADKLGTTRTERTSACINALIEESLREGRVRFSKSNEARIFRVLRDLMNKNFYKVLDSKEERLYQRENLKIVLEFIGSEELSGNLDPGFVVSMLTDNEVNWLADLLRQRKPTKDDFLHINKLSALEIVNSLDPEIEIQHNKSPLWELSP